MYFNEYYLNYFVGHHNILGDYVEYDPKKARKIAKYFAKARGSRKRPLFNLNIHSENYNQYSTIAYDLLNYSVPGMDTHLNMCENRFIKSVEEYILTSGKLLFTQYEISYLYDLYVLYIGLAEYNKKLNVNFDTILNSDYYAELVEFLSWKGM